MAVVIPVAVALLFLIPPVEVIVGRDPTVRFTSSPNSTPYSTERPFCCLIAAFIAIRNKNIAKFTAASPRQR